MNKAAYEIQYNIKLLEIGTEVRCACPEKCGNVGVITGYIFEDNMYALDTGAAYFDYAKLLTKLDKAMK